MFLVKKSLESPQKYPREVSNEDSANPESISPHQNPHYPIKLDFSYSLPPYPISDSAQSNSGGS